jgi:Tol biopolymer transport system component
MTARTVDHGSVWVYDLDRTTPTPLTADGEAEIAIWWPPDGRRLVLDWLAGGRASLASLAADGSASPQLLAPGHVYPSSFEPTGRQLVAVRNDDIVLVTFENGQARLQPWLQTPEEESGPEISPDGHWLAYTLRVLDRKQVYVRPYPVPGPAERVSIGEGSSPAWNPAGGELFFTGRTEPTAARSMMVADFAPGRARRFGQPRSLFPLGDDRILFDCKPVRCYDPAPNGQQFYAVQRLARPDAAVVTHVNFIPNWFEQLKEKVPVKR